MLTSKPSKRILRVDFLGNKVKGWQFQPAITLLTILLFIFIGFSSYIALRLQKGIIPDERVHFAVSKHFSTAWGIPADAPETYQYGPMRHRSYLYYWINARVINFLTFLKPSISDWWLFLTLRITSVIYATLTIIFCFLLGREVIHNDWWALLAVVLLTNTLMFVFLAGGVNYDNLANLLCFAGIYFLIRVINRKSFYPNSLGWIICMLSGALVKISVLPLVLCTALVWLVFIIWNRRQISFRPVFDWKLVWLLALAGLLVILNLSLYGENLIKYRSLSPACRLILTEEQCNKNPVVRRDLATRLQEGLTMQDILRGNGQDPVEWFFDYFSPTMIKAMYGVMGHKTYYPDLILTFYRLFFIGVILVTVRNWRKPSWVLASLLITTGFYLLFLAGTSYRGELGNGFKHFATQGRYAFPVIGAVYVIVIYMIAGISNKWLRWSSVGLAVVLFLWGGPILTFTQHTMAWLPPMGNYATAQQELAEVADGTAVSQDFVSECYHLIDSFSLTLGPGKSITPVPLTLRLTELDSQRIVFEQTHSVKMGDLPAQYTFRIPKLEDSRGKNYRITLSSPESQPGQGIMVMGSTGDMYSGGLARVNGNPADSDLPFRYYCKQGNLDGWFYGDGD